MSMLRYDLREPLKEGLCRKMWKLFKSRKALSPVVAAIILIAVTVAVSIAVAAWMGALTFTFMKTEELKITGISWGGSNRNATLTVKNTGTGALTITSVKLNDANGVLSYYRTPGGTWTAFPSTGLAMNPGDTYELWVQRDSSNPPTAFASGTKYEFAFHTATGNRYPYTATAP